MTRWSNLIARFSGFSLIGAANTLLSMAMICIMNKWCGIDCRLSYVIAYVLTVLVAYVANARLVFHSRLSVKGMFSFYTAYLSGMVLGMLLLTAGRCFMPSVDVTLLSCSVIFITTVWNFFWVNRLLSDGIGAKLKGSEDG